MLRSKLMKKGDGRLAKKRCPRCKKVRTKWLDPNYIYGDDHREMWQRHEEQLICHICADRLGLPPRFAKDPDVHSHKHIQKPKFQHDCKKCVFLGGMISKSRGMLDIYWCPSKNKNLSSIIGRYGSDGHEYYSSHPPEAFAGPFEFYEKTDYVRFAIEREIGRAHV